MLKFFVYNDWLMWLLSWIFELDDDWLWGVIGDTGSFAIGVSDII